MENTLSKRRYLGIWIRVSNVPSNFLAFLSCLSHANLTNLQESNLETTPTLWCVKHSMTKSTILNQNQSPYKPPK